MNALSLFFLLFIFVSSIEAQVTIGANEAPVEGALLQLKSKTGVTDGSENATAGLLLPRVSLTSLTSLDGIDTGDSETAYTYTGLVVYHIADTTQSSYFNSGVYVWIGTQWERLDRDSVGAIRWGLSGQ